MSVRRLRADEAPLLRDIRLRALQDAPHAFGSTYAREVAFADAEWEARARRAAAAEEVATFVAEPAAGIATGALSDEDPGLAHLFGMWVAPEARGRGLAVVLLDAVIAWAAERRPRLQAVVEQHNASAAALYTRAGFTPTGERGPLGHSGLVGVVLERPLQA